MIRFEIQNKIALRGPAALTGILTIRDRPPGSRMSGRYKYNRQIYWLRACIDGCIRIYKYMYIDIDFAATRISLPKLAWALTGWPNLAFTYGPWDDCVYVNRHLSTDLSDKKMRQRSPEANWYDWKQGDIVPRDFPGSSWRSLRRARVLHIVECFNWDCDIHEFSLFWLTMVEIEMTEKMTSKKVL